MTAPRVRYWMFNYRPEWEAVSKEILSLREGLAGSADAGVVSVNTEYPDLRLRGPDKRLPLPRALPLLPLVHTFASRADCNHLFASAGERWLGHLLIRHHGVLTVAKGSGDLARVERNAGLLRRYRAVVAQCERDRDLMRQLGLPDRAVRLIRPGIPLGPYREPEGPFTILFASSPLSAGDFLSRGVRLLLHTAARVPDVRFLLVWRERHIEKLRRLIAESGAGNVEVCNGVVRDMAAMYQRAHAAVLPALEHGAFIPAPRSGLEALAHGRPLLASHYVSIAGSVQAWGAGVAFEPTVDGLVGAIARLRDRYGVLQPLARSYIEEHFSPAVHLELHRRLYLELAG